MKKKAIIGIIHAFLPIKHISVKNSSWQEANYLAQQIQVLLIIEELIKKQNALNINNNGKNVDFCLLKTFRRVKKTSVHY